MAGLSDYQHFSGHKYDFNPIGGVGDELAGRRSRNEFSMYSRASPRMPYGAGGDGFQDASGYRTPRNVGFRTPPGHISPSSPDDPSGKTYAARGINLVGIVTENLLSHPFLVLKRQCQVNSQSRRYHLFPLTLVGPVFHICQRQGLAVLWKGLGSTLIVSGMTLAVEDIVSKITSWPKEINRHSRFRQCCQHILLKSISIAAIAPFYSASLVETVQSEVASETTGLLDVFREGLWRLLTPPSTGRLVPLYVLIIPTVAHGLLSYLIYRGIKSVSLSAIRRARENKERSQGALSKDCGFSFHTEMTASLIGHMVADCLLYPLECVLHRLHIQGTRTIIDSLDSGIEVTPILMSYSGTLDCIRTTVEEEGTGGLYKGFGALVLQYGIQILVIRTVKLVMEKNPFGQSSVSHAAYLQEKYPAGLPEAGRITPPGFHHSKSEPGSVAQGNVEGLSRTPTRALGRLGSSHELEDISNVRSRTKFSLYSPPDYRN